MTNARSLLRPFVAIGFAASIAACSGRVAPLPGSPLVPQMTGPLGSAPVGPVVVNPTSVVFTAVGAAHAVNVKVTQANFAGRFRQVGSCTAPVATLVEGGSPGKRFFTVTPLHPGSCTAIFVGAGGMRAPLPVSVVPGSVVLSPTALRFTAASPADAKTATVTQSNYSNAFGESDTCAKIATLAAASNGGGKAHYTVTPIGPGSCSAKFSGGNHIASSLPISVVLPPPVVAAACKQSVDACANGTSTAPGSVQFTAKGDRATLTPSDPSWSNAPNFTLRSDTCNKTDDPSAGGNWATLAPAIGQSAAAFTLTAINGGTNADPAKCTAVFADGAGRAVRINVEITLGTIGIHVR